MMYINYFSIKLGGKETCNKYISNKLLAKNFVCHAFMNPWGTIAYLWVYAHSKLRGRGQNGSFIGSTNIA